MSKKKRRSKPQTQQPEPVKTGCKTLLNYLLAFAFGVVITGGVVMLIGQGGVPNTNQPNPAKPSPVVAGHRSVADLMALSDAELEQVDVVEMNIAVAREIPGLEDLDYNKYRQIVDAWTAQFRAWLPTVEHAYYERPDYFKKDINFFRLGMLTQFLDQTVGVCYVEEQRQAQVDARKAGCKAEVAYTDPRHLLLHGLIDTKRGTCGTMPALHVAIARRMGWPVGLACAESHYVCRYDDGKTVYNIEATDTGRGGFAAGSDQDYIEKEGVSRKAIAVGSDLRKLTAREMLGVFVQARARHFADTGKVALAARDYALAHTMFPNSRKVYIGLVGNLLPVGEKLFARSEDGHPMSLAAYLSGQYAPRSSNTGLARSPIYQHDPVLEAERINAINQANMRRMMQPPMAPQPHQPPVPGAGQPPQPHQPR
ncbi:MAG: transglutaminase family protein [Phycisphaerae bacterium]